ncbi:MAG: DUF2141 domain-containing protein [Flavobacteriales bacterium]
MVVRSLSFLLASLGALGLWAQGTASIHIEVKLNKPPAGDVRLALCPDSATFENEEGCRFEKLKATGTVVVFDLSGLAPGNYAIRAVHDVDADGDIDVNKLGIPTEPFGFSNDAMGKMGPPGFEQAKFKVKPGTNSVSFRMRGG